MRRPTRNSLPSSTQSIVLVLLVSISLTTTSENGDILDPEISDNSQWVQDPTGSAEPVNKSPAGQCAGRSLQRSFDPDAGVSNKHWLRMSSVPALLGEQLLSYPEGDGRGHPKPPRPLPPKVRENSDGTVQILWTALPEGTVTSYVILAAENDAPKFRAITRRIPVVKGQKECEHKLWLTSDVRYSFKVAGLLDDTKVILSDCVLASSSCAMHG